MVNKKIEKYAIFSRGFRGLPDGWHNLRSMNFLVGENSSGKSSFLQLIEIIDSPLYLFFLKICGIVPGIDTAFDVCSRLSGTKETTVGYFLKRKPKKSDPDSESEKEEVHFGKLTTYKMVDDRMQLTRLTILSGNKVVRLKRSQGKISSKIADFMYDESLSHTENASEFERLHLDRKLRFRTEREVNWSEVQEHAVWMNTLQSVEFREFGEDGGDFLQAGSPLNCLQYGPLRGKTRRLNHGLKNDFSSTGEHFPYLIKSAISDSSDLYSTIEKFGQDSGLFDGISIASVKTEVKDKPFAVQIRKADSYFYLDELGFGVGQILPIIADIALSSKRHAFLIQQPELHLHPKAQASLGDVFLKASEAGGMLVVETHSDFIIDRFRLRHKQSEDAPRAQIIYFESDEGARKNQAYEIEFQSDGSLADVPIGYRKFFVNESFEQFENI